MEIIKSYRQSVPAMRFIGKRYGDEDRIDGGFGAKWGEWFEKGWFELIEKQIDKDMKDIYEDSDAYIGLMRWKDGEPFEYWIGMFTPLDTVVPDGFENVDFEAKELGVCWIKGIDGEVYGKEAECAERLKAEGFTVVSDEKDAWWFFERYACPRFTTPDEDGKIILDICHCIK